MPQEQTILPDQPELKNTPAWKRWLYIGLGLALILAVAAFFIFGGKSSSNGASTTGHPTPAYSSNQLSQKIDKLGDEREAWEEEVGKIQDVTADLNERAQALTDGKRINQAPAAVATGVQADTSATSAL